MRNPSTLWIVAGIMIILDLYVFTAIRTVANHASERTKIFIYTIYWIIAVAAIVTLLLFPSIRDNHTSAFVRDYLFIILVGLFVTQLLITVFLLIDDIRRGLTFLITKIVALTAKDEAKVQQPITRSVFLSWLGIAIGGSFFSTLMYGFTNKYNYKIRRVKLSFKNLPSSFKGFKIVQISDIHSGSFKDKKAVERGVNMIMQESADLVLFTGDLVNNTADEMNDYKDVFDKIKAPHGVFSTLGNHDYGDYKWGAHPTGQAAIEKAENLKQLLNVHKQMGWRILMNEHVAIDKNGEAFALIGIENWGAKAGFPKYGRMDLAYPGAEKYPFKILMSHDPSHWDAEVRVKYPDIDLTLAGHTHGMQFGVETPFFRWSPVQWIYKEWAGLYKKENQHLYVNRGYGFIGYPGRVGILPEITVIEFV